MAKRERILYTVTQDSQKLVFKELVKPKKDIRTAEEVGKEVNKLQGTDYEAEKIATVIRGRLLNHFKKQGKTLPPFKATGTKGFAPVDYSFLDDIADLEELPDYTPVKRKKKETDNVTDAKTDEDSDGEDFEEEEDLDDFEEEEEDLLLD
jgi:hypothetical protein